MTAHSHIRAHTATLVVVGAGDRLTEAVRVLEAIDQAGSVRRVLISTDTGAAPPVVGDEEVVAIAGLKPEHVNNAIAAQRLSSLPTVVWWRGGEPARLDAVAELADRVVLDGEDPLPLWDRVLSLVERTAISDVRWARLTRWRAVMAHFFDLPQVRGAAPDFTDLHVTGVDRASCTLFAGWLDASLGWHGRVAVELVAPSAGPSMAAVRLAGPHAEIVIQLLPHTTCLETRARIGDHQIATRVVSLGDQRLPALLSEELRVRSRDLAFEGALAAATELGL